MKLVGLAVLLVVLVSGCVQDAGLANPAAVYCEEQGFTYDIRTEEGGERGYCVFPDGSECDGWAYYRGECPLLNVSADYNSLSECRTACEMFGFENSSCMQPSEAKPTHVNRGSCLIPQSEQCGNVGQCDCYCYTAEILYVDLTPSEAKDLIEAVPELVIIDVSPNYMEGHLPGAVNYYLGDGSLDRAIPALNKKDFYLVYCHFDSASIQGAQKLVDAGFENVFRLEGNYQAWVDAGYEIEV